MNSPDLVGERTRENVIRIIKELHYTPSQMARNLSMQSSSTIGVIVPEISNSFFGELFSGIEAVINKYNLSLLYAGNDNDIDADYKALDIMRMQRVKGLLYIPAVNYCLLDALDDLQKKLDLMNCPVVCMDRDVGLRCDIVHFDDRSAVRKAVLALAKGGHRKIAIITGEEENILTTQRFKGYLEGLRQANLPYDDRLVFRGSYTRISGYLTTKKLIVNSIQPTAVITCNNLLSKGYIQAVCECNEGKIDMYTHIGLDEIDMMQYLGIPYNCIQRDSYKVGNSAAELLIKRLESSEENYKRVVLDSPLIHQTF